MRVFVAGASGAIGTRLVPQLIDAGHEVIGTYTVARATPSACGRSGAEPVALDLLDARAVREAVLAAEPDAIVHQATALADMQLLAQLRPQLRARPTGCGPRAPTRCSPPRARRACAGSSPRASPAPATRARAGRSRPRTTRSTRRRSRRCARAHAAMRHLDEAVTDAGGIALRYGGFYGAANDGLVEPVRKRQFPIVGDGGGVSSFIHLDDAAAATVLALEHDGAGHLQHRRRRARAGARVAAGARGGARRQAAAPRSRAGWRGWSPARPR